MTIVIRRIDSFLREPPHHPNHEFDPIFRRSAPYRVKPPEGQAPGGNFSEPTGLNCYNPIIVEGEYAS